MIGLTVKLTPAPETFAQKFARLADTGIYESMARKGAEIDDMMMGALQAEAPRRTGNFVSTIQSTQHASGKGSLTYVYTAAQPLATYIVGGTAAHEIVPVNAKVLAFMGAGGLVFAHHVSHPGTQPNDFPSRAWQNISGDVARLWAETGQDLKTEVMG